MESQVPTPRNPQPATRKPYPTDVSDDEWAFVAPYLSVMTPDAPERRHDLREVFNALRWIVHTGAPWRYLPGDLPPWPAVYQQTRRWLAAGVFEAMASDLRALLRWAAGRNAQSTAVIFDSATRQSTPGERTPRGLRRLQTPHGQQAPRRGRHLRPPAGPARDPG